MNNNSFDEYVQDNAPEKDERPEYTAVDMLYYDLGTLLYTIRLIMESLDTTNQDLRDVIGPHMIGARHMVEAAYGNLEKFSKVRQ